VSGQRKALIIANDEYEHEALRNLLAPAADAEALGRVLGDPQIGDFAVQVVRNEPAHVVLAHIEEVLSESRPDDVLVLHFSGHGLKSESGELFFAASNTRPNRLGSTAVPADFVQRCLRESRSRSVVLLLDCCYGGAFAQGVKVRAAGDVNVLDSFPQGRSGGGRGRAVITASSAMEYAFEGDQLGDDQQRRPSVFTSALVQGLATGDADRDEDGWISLDELYDYVFDKVREQNPHQTPSRQFELEGELYLARSRRQRIRPAPIPADLQAALADPNMYTRLGAVTELRARLTSGNLPAAAAAYEALDELARTATRYLADPAAEALSQAAVQPAQTELHFGTVEQGSARPHLIVRLLGPPIARACVPRPSGDWIRVDEVEEGLDISIDTAGTGTLRGSLALKGPTGEAVIAIDIDLVSPPQTPSSHRPGEPAYREVVAPAAPADQPAPPPASQLLPSDSPPLTTGAPAHEASGRASPASDLSPTSGESLRPQPAQQAAERQPEAGNAPDAGTAVQDESAPVPPASGETPRLAGRQQGPARERALSRTERQSRATWVWAAGSAVLGVLLLLGALTQFSPSDGLQPSLQTVTTPLWPTVLALAILGVLITAFERPFKRLGTFVHGWNFICSISIALFVIYFAYSPSYYYNRWAWFPGLLVAGAAGNAICVVIGCVLIARGARSASNLILSITAGLLTAAALILALSSANAFGSGNAFSSNYPSAGVTLLIAASFASLLDSVVVLLPFPVIAGLCHRPGRSGHRPP